MSRLDIEIGCICGNTLTITETQGLREDITFITEPCETCLSNEYKRAYEQGRNDIQETG